MNKTVNNGIIDSNSSSQLPLFSPNSDHLDDSKIQESTMQVPCGAFSIFDLSCHRLNEFDRAVYWMINEHSNWDTGISHGLPYRVLTDLLNVNHSSQVKRAVRHLIDAGFLEIVGNRLSDGANIYRVIHHKCLPDEVPLDKDNRPFKCAVPRGKGSGSALLSKGEISWREFVQWMVNKVSSDWSTGEVLMTVNMANDRLRLSGQTICNSFRSLEASGLLERISAKFRASIFRIFPKPYPKRKDRAEDKGKKPLPRIGDWYYSYNRRWCFHKDNFHVLKKDEFGKWRDSSMQELYKVNVTIHRDFNDYMSAYASEEFSDALSDLRLALSN